jgi:hypothetical protein
MVQFAQNVAFLLPNAQKRASLLLYRIQSCDAGFNAMIAQIKSDEIDNAKRSDFEAMASFLVGVVSFYNEVYFRRRC